MIGLEGKASSFIMSNNSLMAQYCFTILRGIIGYADRDLNIIFLIITLPYQTMILDFGYIDPIAISWLCYCKKQQSFSLCKSKSTYNKKYHYLIYVWLLFDAFINIFVVLFYLVTLNYHSWYSMNTNIYWKWFYV